MKRLSDHLRASLETAEALGRSIIVEKDASLSFAAKSLPGKFIVGNHRMSVASASWFVCDDKAVRISYDLIPEDVLEYIRYKAFTIAGVEDGQLLEEVKGQIQKAIEAGTDFKDFKLQVNAIFESYGVTKVFNNHLKTVFRTNIFAAYSVAQLRQVQGMPDRFPVWRYMAIRDNRTRASHLELNDKVFKIGDGPIPPIDYNCRCTPQFMHVTEVERQGLVPEKWTKNERLQQLDIRKSFDEWVSKNEGIITPGAKKWIGDQK